MEVPQSLRAIDTAQERVIMSFLEKHLYANLYADYEIVSDRKRQLAGIDVVIQTPERTRYDDVKAQSSPRYINDPRPTFALEILFDHFYQEHEGWFVRDDLSTTTYCFVWINKAIVNQQGYIDKEENIHEVEAMFVDKAALRKYLGPDYSPDKLLAEARYMRNTNEAKYHPERGLTIVYSNFLNERPVNLVVHKRILKDLSFDHYKVTQKGLTKL